MFAMPAVRTLAFALAMAMLGATASALLQPACAARPSFTTEDFRRLKTSWPEFADAVAERNRHLGKLEQMLSPAEWEELMQDVKAWQARRTDEVAVLMQGGMPYRDACLKSLLDRVVVLHGYLREGRLGSPSRWLEPGASNLHYLYYRMASPRYRQATDELNALWKRLRAELPAEEFQPLLEEQRAWLASSGRDVLRLMDQGCTNVEACTQVTEARIENLSRRFGVSEDSFRLPAGRQGQSSFAGRQPVPRPAAEQERRQAGPAAPAGSADSAGGEQRSWQASRREAAPPTNNEVDDHDVRMLQLVEEAGKDFAPE